MSDKIPLVAVIGHPIAHSKSPLMHGYWLKQNDIRGHYVPLDVHPDDFQAVLAMLPKMGFVGANVTIPHKEAALKLADTVSDRAALIGAANTLTFRPDGKIYADNTDGYGFIENIKSTQPDWDPTSGPAVVLGAGGASRAVLVALLDEGVPEIILANRTKIRAEQLKTDFGGRITVVDWAKVGNYLETAATLVNTTSLGMVGKPELTVPLDGLTPNCLVCDIVYNPLITPLLQRATEIGCPVVTGIGMLIHQGTPGFSRWFGVDPVVTPELQELLLA